MLDDVFNIVGTTLVGTFRIEEVIAEGGFGVVYRAEHVAFRAPVALKCLKVPGTISHQQSEAFVENFREEAEILFHLSAQIPEVVRPLHADAMTLKDGTFVPYIAMEWIDGKPLDSIIILRDEGGQEPLSLKRVTKMLRPIAHALGKAHRFVVPGGPTISVTHADLKPENILITERDNPIRAKILDFGIAKARDAMVQGVGKITKSKEAAPFTPGYGAPEQWVPKRYGQVGPWTDVWGMALTIVEAVTGKPPIDGDMHAMMGTALDKNRRPTPRNEGIDISEASERVFERAMAVDPRDRYQSIEEFWTALEKSLGLGSSFARMRALADDIEDDETGRPGAPDESDDYGQEFGLDGIDEGSDSSDADEWGDDFGDDSFDEGLDDLDLGGGEFEIPGLPNSGRGGLSSRRFRSANVPDSDPGPMSDSFEDDEPPSGEFSRRGRRGRDEDEFDPDEFSIEDDPDSFPLEEAEAPSLGGGFDADAIDLDDDPMSTQSGSYRSPSASRSGSFNRGGRGEPNSVAKPPSLRPERATAGNNSIRAALAKPMILVGVGTVITIGHLINPINLGGLKLSYLGGLLVIVGLLMAFLSLIDSDDDDDE